MGFINNTSDLYSETNCVIHFNSNESLGRIFLESVYYQVPFIGFNSGGIGEIADLLGLHKNVVDLQNDWIESMYRVLCDIINNPAQSREDISSAFTRMKGIFSVSGYVSKLEEAINK